MSAVGGVFTGALSLAALQVLVTTSASGGVASLFNAPGAWARKFIDPTVPLIPDIRSSQTKSLQTALQTAYQQVSSGQGSNPYISVSYPSPSALPPAVVPPATGSGTGLIQV